MAEEREHQDDAGGQAEADGASSAKPGPETADDGADAERPGAGRSGAGSAGAGSAGAGKTGADSKDDDADRVDLKGIFRQLTAPMVESIDSRLREQVETHVDALLTTKVEAAVSDRLATVDRAIADLSRAVEDLERRVSELEAERDA